MVGRTASRARRGRRRRGAGPGLDPPAGKRTAQTVSDVGGPAGHPRRRAVPSPVHGAEMTSRVMVEVYVAGTAFAGTATHHPTGAAPGSPMVIDPRPVAAEVS